MTNLDDLFDVADARLLRASEAPAADRPTATRHLDLFLSDLVGGLAPADDGLPPSPVSSALVHHLGKACDALQAAQRLMPASGTEPAESSLLDATAAVNAVHDIIESPRGPDRVPLSPYVFAFSTRPAQDYLTRRSAELAWRTGEVVRALAQGVTDPAVVAAFADARRALSQRPG